MGRHRNVVSRKYHEYLIQNVIYRTQIPNTLYFRRIHRLLAQLPRTLLLRAGRKPIPPRASARSSPILVSFMLWVWRELVMIGAVLERAEFPIEAGSVDLDDLMEWEQTTLVSKMVGFSAPLGGIFHACTVVEV